MSTNILTIAGSDSVVVLVFKETSSLFQRPVHMA